MGQAEVYVRGGGDVVGYRGHHEPGGGSVGGGLGYTMCGHGGLCLAAQADYAHVFAKADLLNLAPLMLGLSTETWRVLAGPLVEVAWLQQNTLGWGVRVAPAMYLGHFTLGAMLDLAAGPMQHVGGSVTVGYMLVP